MVSTVPNHGDPSFVGMTLFFGRRRVFLRRLEALAQDFCLGEWLPLLSTNGSGVTELFIRN